MTIPNQQVWIYAAITMALKTTGATTTYNIINRPALSESGDYYPLLVNISSLGAAMDDFMPLTNVGTITIANGPNSFGFERKFSDLFDRYVPLEQEVVVYAWQTAIGNNSPISTAVQVYKARIKSYRINVDAQTVDLNIESAPIQKRIMNRLVDPTETATDGSMRLAPTTSYGAPIPIVFGNAVQVKPIIVSQVYDGSSNGVVWAYATTLKNSTNGFIVGGVDAYYVKDYDGIYRAFKSAASPTTEVNGYSSAPAAAPGTGIGNKEFAWETTFASASTDNYLVHGVMFKLAANTIGGALSGNITFRLYEKDITKRYPSQTPLATATLPKSDYIFDWNNYAVNKNFTVMASFDKFVLMSKSSNYYLSIAGSNEVAGATSETKINLGGTASQNFARSSTSTTSASNEWGPDTTLGSNAPYFALYGAAFTDHPDSAGYDAVTGLGYASTSGSFGGNLSTSSIAPDPRNLDLVLSVNGFQDDVLGTITGSANSRIKSAKHACDLLTRNWVGTSWITTNGRLDTTKYSSYQAGANNTGTAYERLIAGASTGIVTVEDLLYDICRNSMARVATISGTTTNKYLGFWAHGQANATSAVITDEESRIVSIDLRGTETVVNNVQASYGKQLTAIDPNRWLGTLNFSDAIGTITLNSTSSAIGAALAGVSATAFDQRYLSDTRFLFIGDSTSASNLAQAIIGKYAFPAVYVELDVPFFKYSTLALLDVIEIVHPDLPAYFGTSSDAHNPTYTGTEVDMRENLYWKRAQRYRAQIESKTFDFNLGAVPTLKIIARLLLNSPNDPT